MVTVGRVECAVGAAFPYSGVMVFESGVLRVDIAAGVGMAGRNLKDFGFSIYVKLFLGDLSPAAARRLHEELVMRGDLMSARVEEMVVVLFPHNRGVRETWFDIPVDLAYEVIGLCGEWVDDSEGVDYWEAVDELEDLLGLA